MSCNIQTGISLVPSAPPAGNCVSSAPGRSVLFAPDTLAGTVYSPSFTVTPGNAVLIDAYNMVEDFHIYVNRLSITAPCSSTGCNCNPADMANAFGGSSIMAGRERMTIGNAPANWALYKSSSDSTQNKTQILITLPGTYELELENTASQLGMMEVDLQQFSLKDIGCIPAVYHAGVK